jgi:RNA-directed DNA polymerase
LYRLQSVLNKPNSPKYVFKADILKCFDNISHEYIERKIYPILCKSSYTFINKWIKTGIVEKNGKIVYPNKGTPQGGVISSLLCNMILNRIDQIIKPNYPQIGTKLYKSLSGCWSIRYVDDIIITCPNEFKIRNEYVPKLKEFLAEKGLEIPKDKSKILNLEVGCDTLQYLN